MGTDIAFNPIYWVGLIIALISLTIGIVEARKAKKEKLARLDKKQGEIDKRDKPEGGR